MGWVGHRSVAPPVVPVFWALVCSLLRRSVALGSCAPYPVGSSLEDSYGFVVQAPGVFLKPNPFWGGVVVFLRPPSVCQYFLWLVATLWPGLSLDFADGLSSPGLSCC